MENIKELFAEWGLWSLVEDISDDGDGTGDNLQLTKEGSEAQRMIDQELDKAREEGKRDATEKLRLAFHEVFFKSGELWFDYLFEDGDIEAEQDAREVVEEYWEEVVSKLKDNK